MTDLQNSAAWPEDFCGTARLFPLPNLVLFPNVVQPLHIFEPRYCEMLADAMENDRLIAMALLQIGWESKYQSKPPIAKTVCVGKVISHTPTEDGRHNILLVGLRRARILEEIEEGQSFRMASVEVIEDVYSSENDEERPAMTEKLQQLFAKFIPEGLASQESFQQLLGKQLPLGVLTDTITFAIDLPMEIKQKLLDESNVDTRCRILTKCLEQKLRRDAESKPEPEEPTFPPRFSDN